MPTYFFVNPTNANLSWSLASSWATSSGGTGGTLSFPTASDDVFFNANSGTGTCSIFAAASCRSLDFTGYNGSINFQTQTLTLTSSTTFTAGAKLALSPTMTITGSSGGTLRIVGAFDFTSSGESWDNVTFAGGLTLPNRGVTLRLADNAYITSNITYQGAAFVVTASTGVTMSIGGNITSAGTLTFGGTHTSSVAIQATGSVNQTWDTANSTISSPTFIIDKAPTSWLNVSSGNIRAINTELKRGFVTGTFGLQYFVNQSNLTYTIKSNNNIWNSTGSIFNLSVGKNETGITGNTLTLLDDFKVFSGSRLLLNGTLGGSGVQTINGPGDLYFGDSTNLASQVTMSFNVGGIQGTAIIRIQGSGQISIVNTSISYPTKNPIIINTPGTVNFADGTFVYQGLSSSPSDIAASTLTYTAGTIGSTTLIPSNCTLQTNGMTWNIVQPSNTIRLTNDLQATTIQVSANTTFTGSAGFTANSTISSPTFIIDKAPTSWLNVSSGNIRAINTELKRGFVTGTFGLQYFVNQSNLTYTIKSNNNIWNSTGSIFNLSVGKNETGITGNTLTLLDDFKVFSGSRLLLNGTLGGSGVQTINGPGDLYFGDSTNLASQVTMSFNVGGIQGTAIIRIQGSGQISIVNTSISYPTKNPIIINTPGTVNFADGTFVYQGLSSSPSDIAASTLTYTAGTIGSTTLIPSNCTLQTNGMTWNIVQPSNTIRLTNDLQATTIQVSANTTFTGSAGFTASNYTQTTAGTTTTFQNGNSYLVTNALTGVGTAASPIVFRASASNTPRAIFTHQNGGSQTMIYVSGNFIDSSQGQTIWTFGTILNNTINWNTGTKPTDRSSTFVN